jgi:alpha-galactosidase
MNRRQFGIIAAGILLISAMGCGCRKSGTVPVDETSLAQKPPMGWNSWNCFGSDVNEKQVRANAGFMAEKIKAHGWEYIVVDFGWYPGPETNITTFKQPRPVQAIDGYGRLVPDTKKFPSAARGKDFKKMADAIHQKGLKFGIHIMRGIPKRWARNPWNGCFRSSAVSLLKS